METFTASEMMYMNAGMTSASRHGTVDLMACIGPDGASFTDHPINLLQVADSPQYFRLHRHEE